jgi:hypothetical protein
MSNAHHINIEASRGEYAMTCEIHLASQADFEEISLLDPIEIEYNGETYNFVVDEVPRRSRSLGKTNYIVSGASKAVLMDEPFADLITTEYAASTAEEIAQDICDEYGVTLDWQILNWPIGANKLYANDETPISVIKKLAASVGAILQSDADGTLIVMRKYPVDIDKLSDATPDAYMTDQANFYSVEESYSERPGYNRYLIGDESTSDATYTLEQEDVNETQKTIKGYIVPFVATGVSLLDSGGTWVNTQAEGIQTESITETVEFVNGQGTTSKPIYSAPSVSWKQTSLGAVSYLEDGTLTAATASESLAEITYTTKYHKWLVTDPNIEELQLILDIE